MLEAQSIIARLQTEMPVFGSVEGAAELAALMAAPPQVFAKPRAHVVPMGINGGAVVDAAGAFVQTIEHLFAVYMSISAHGDRKGGKKLEDVSVLQNSLVLALCGWSPPGLTTCGDIRLKRAYLVELKPGLIVYAIDFAVPDQLRIYP